MRMSDLCIIPCKAVADERLTHCDIRVLCAIGKHTDKGGQNSWASARTFAREAAINRSQFFISAKRLLELGYIRRRERVGRTSVYSIVLESKTLGVQRRLTRPVKRDGSTPVQKTKTPPVPTNGTAPVQSSGTLTSPERKAVNGSRVASPLENSPSTLTDRWGAPMEIDTTPIVPLTPAEKENWRAALHSVGVGPRE